MFHLNENVMGETSGKRKAICLSLLSNSFLLIHLGIFFPSEIAFCMPEYTSLFFCLTQSNHSGLQTSHVIASTCQRKGNTVLLGHIVLLKITHILSSKGNNTEILKICCVIHIIYILGSLNTFFSQTW